MAGSVYNVQRALSALSVFLAIVFLFTLNASLSPNSHIFDLDLVTTAGNGTQSSGFNSARAVQKSVESSVLNSIEGMENKLFVIIVAGFRTGSTLLGDFFNENPDVVYIFEPLHQKWLSEARENIPGSTPDTPIDQLQLLYLKNLFETCDTYTPDFFWQQMKQICCKDEEDSLRKFGNTQCRKPNKYLTSLCKKFEATVVKTIRLRDIGDLGKIEGIEKHKFKVIHLIRDPRGTVNSRWHGFLTFYLKDQQVPVEPITNDKIRMVANDYCERELHNVILTDENMPEWLKGRYLRVTHTQMSLDPSGWLDKIYNWLEIPLPQSVRDHVMEIENDKTVENHTIISNLFSVRKDSKAVLEKWSKDLEPEWVQTIQETCSELMFRLNFTLV